MRDEQTVQFGRVRRVLMTADTIGGVWTYAVELIRALERHGIEVLLATMGRPVSPEQREDLAGLGNVEVAESSYRLEWMDDPWEDVAAAGDWLLGLNREFGPDIVHLNGYAHAALPWVAPKIVVAHSCVSSWWRAVKGGVAPENWQRYQREVRAGLQAADLVIAPTHAMIDCLAENYCDLPRARMIPNGRALELFKAGKKENFILSAGRLWDEAKNVEAVCACSGELPWPVYVAGENECPDGSASKNAPAKSALVQANCLGRLRSREMIGWVSRAAIFAHPAKYEPFGLCVLEAALSGCALVLGDIPALRENWEGAAVFVNPVDHGALREALLRLIKHPSEREQLGRAALERGRQFDIRVAAERYVEAYELMFVGKEELCAAG